MPAKWYDEFYQTEEWKLKKARQKVISDHKKLIRKAAIEIRYSRSLGWFNFYDKESGKYMSHDEVSERVPEFNLDILHGRLIMAGIDINDYIK